MRPERGGGQGQMQDHDSRLRGAWAAGEPLEGRSPLDRVSRGPCVGWAGERHGGGVAATAGAVAEGGTAWGSLCRREACFWAPTAPGPLP